MNDYWGLLLSYVFVLSILGGGEALRALYSLPPYFTRKIIHIGVGHWLIAAYWLIEARELALIPPFTFIFINYLSTKKQIFKAMESRESMGTVYYALALFLLILFFWSGSLKVLAITGALIMAWGDGLAEIAGKRWGNKTIPFIPYHKTYMGSATMCIVSFLVALSTLYFFGPWDSSITVLSLSIMVAIAATILEALGGNGWDNLTVPLGSAFLLYFLGVL